MFSSRLGCLCCCKRGIAIGDTRRPSGQFDCRCVVSYSGINFKSGVCLNTISKFDCCRLLGRISWTTELWRNSEPFTGLRVGALLTRRVCCTEKEKLRSTVYFVRLKFLTYVWIFMHISPSSNGIMLVVFMQSEHEFFHPFPNTQKYQLFSFSPNGGYRKKNNTFMKR